MERVDIKRLAEKLNLSTSTVSRAFRGNSDINPETKARILAAAKEFNYQPNHHASNLRDKRSNTIAIIVPEIANNFFSQAIHGIERVAREKDYYTLIYLTDDDYDKEVMFVEKLYNGRVDGIIMSASGEANDHRYLKTTGNKQIPLVFFDRVYDDIDVPKVTTDDYASAFSATRHLIEAGCRKVAFLVINKSMSIGNIRMQGYKDALQDAGIPFQEQLVVDCSNDYDKNYHILTDFLVNERPDGLFTAVERLAISSYYVCHDLGINIPGDVKVVSFSSLEIASLLNPALSTITQPAYDLGTHAAEMLFKVLEGIPPQNNHIILGSKLIPRLSSAKM
ncbi:LacI family DNA-binding transcriptional regulator [Chitinophaga sancti]|uniref:LacI family DNA-binding transcriptional regulator n=1 Tax=Chitinophaga sancti TaxID=1004 RepID=A0A1K1QMT4_9BACT|nr:LacI family DNA-binding transcriptional regulator [Chitinophaga sancti]WQD65100.1 LacI family DNA-binding transcriptional regulator [Chitinophaga sancti]WQG89276.1 LacI family DNA-binding transcriptional regulator [Chitinophaga sancti]SFW61077.1 transcriptional regulator, LacI family [Chitinophaga sancti]